MIETSPPAPRYKKGERVALFLPCYCDALFPQVGVAMVKLFARLNVPLDYPMDQTCCGQPAFNAGDWTQAAALARRFADVFKDYRWIVVPSGSCGAMARIFYPMLESAANAADTGSRVYDVASFLVDVLGRHDVGATFRARVTYHDGCHARRELRATSAALALLRKVRELEYVELAHMEECCGFGGLFAVKYAELSTSMGTAKVQAIRASGAMVVASSDMSCLMHIEGLAQKTQPRNFLRFVHLAEVLASEN
jgi:L-lactate dehydrogenase complex protein LldE